MWMRVTGQKALKTHPAAKAAWEGLSFTHQKEHAQALEGAKKPETRALRLQKTLQMLKVRSGRGATDVEVAPARGSPR